MGPYRSVQERVGFRGDHSPVRLQLEGVRKRFRGGVEALRGVDLEIEQGMFGLLGPNGAGKTTFLRIVAGLVNPSGGRVRIGELDPTREPDRTRLKEMLGYLPQEFGVYPELSARSFLDYLAILKGLADPRERRRRVDEVLELVGLSTVANRQLKEYSGGMKRRVGIAQALLNDPQLLIVDEPTAGLDPEERIRFRNLLADLAGNRLVLLSTHIVEDIGQTCREMAVLHRGRILFRGTPGELAGRARGHVWEIVIPHGQRPNGGLAIVATVQLQEGTRYRVVGETVDHPGATAVPPTLEDGYVWLMRTAEKP